jgi:hypothetical protein
MDKPKLLSLISFGLVHLIDHRVLQSTPTHSLKPLTVHDAGNLDVTVVFFFSLAGISMATRSNEQQNG